MSRSDLSSFVLSFVLVQSGRELGGLSMFVCLWFSISVFGLGLVLNQRQLSIVVPDWEPYLGSLFSIVFGGWLFSVFVCLHQTELFRLFLCCFVNQCSVYFIKMMNTYHAAHWSSPSSHDSRYNSHLPTSIYEHHTHVQQRTCWVLNSTCWFKTRPEHE